MHFMNLSILILFPLATSLAIMAIKSDAHVRWVASMGATFQLLLAVYLFFVFSAQRSLGNNAQMLFESRNQWFPSWNISFHFGVDGISVAMILLTAFVVLAGVLVSWNVSKMTKEYYLLLFLLSLGAYGFFISLDLFVLFFFLEIAVIPKYLLIAIWGSGKNTYAANKLALMLMGASALVLVGLLGIYFSNPTPSFDLMALSKIDISKETQQICFPLLFIGFGIFGALFPFHTWVPDGHASAPTAASMFLAGISMKLGGYGCLRVATYILPEGARQYSDAVIILSSVAILYGAFATMMQSDLKYINAYSSVSHCGFVMLGIGMLTKNAMAGAVMQMVSHGLMTALFFAVIGMIYERTHTRKLEEMGGLLKMMPFISTILFIVGLCSLGLPGFSGFAAEITIFIGSWEKPDYFHRVATIMACMSIVVTAVYILGAVGKTAMGPLKPSTQILTDASWLEKISAIILVLAILSVGLAPSWLYKLVSPATEIVMMKIQTTK